MKGFVYILTNKNNRVLYIGVTSYLWLRVLKHKIGSGSIFTSRYKTTKLVYFERINGIVNSIKREKQLKSWRREWKINLIKSRNPGFEDLALSWYASEDLSPRKTRCSLRS